MRRSVLRVIGVLASASLMFAACTGNNAPGTTGGTSSPTAAASIDPRQTILTMAATFEVQTFDPSVNVAAVSGYRFYPNIYESLIQYAIDGSLEPMLAESWTVSPDGLTYRFKLRPGVKFSDGAPFNAEAVKYGFDRLRTIKKGAVALYEPIGEIKPIDDLTVDLILKRPYAPILQILAAWQGALFVSPAAAKANEVNGDQGQAWFRDHTAGTGPFMLETWEPNTRIVAVRNPHFREPVPADAIQRVVLQLVLEPATSRQLVAGGQIDIVEEIPPSLLDPLRGTNGVTVRTDQRTGDSVAITFNNARDPFKDPNFRRGVAYAIDYGRLVQIYQGIAVQSKGLLAETFAPWFSAQDSKVFKQDMSAAAAEFAKSGYSLPLNPRQKFTLLFQGGQTTQRDMGVLIQEDLAKIGIDLEVVSTDLPVWREAIWKNNFDMAFIGLGPRFPDPDALASLVLASSQFKDRGFNPGIVNAQIDDLVARGLTATTIDGRVKIYAEMQKIVTEQAYFLWLIEKKHAWVHGNNLSGIVWNPNYGPFFRWDQIRKTSVR